MKAARWLLLILVIGSGAASAQSPADLERRVSDLERKMRVLDPSFTPATEQVLIQRVQDLESKIEALLAGRGASRGAATPSMAAILTCPQTSDQS
jgi:hypothetical protein